MRKKDQDSRNGKNYDWIDRASDKVRETVDNVRDTAREWRDEWKDKTEYGAWFDDRNERDRDRRRYENEGRENWEYDNWSRRYDDEVDDRRRAREYDGRRYRDNNDYSDHDRMKDDWKRTAYGKAEEWKEKGRQKMDEYGQMLDKNFRDSSEGRRNENRRQEDYSGRQGVHLWKQGGWKGESREPINDRRGKARQIMGDFRPVRSGNRGGRPSYEDSDEWNRESYNRWDERIRRAPREYGEMKENLRQYAREGADDLRDRAENTYHKAGDSVMSARDRVLNTVEDIGDKVSENTSKLTESVREKGDQLRQKANENMSSNGKSNLSTKSPDDIKESLDQRTPEHEKAKYRN